MARTCAGKERRRRAAWQRHRPAEMLALRRRRAAPPGVFGSRLVGVGDAASPSMVVVVEVEAAEAVEAATVLRSRIAKAEPDAMDPDAR